ncbi:hypothetical protein U9M48_009943 [Paspalum notatum var. saurae]|uniref:TF-B3 domain-containing protein n=1 Tax=Paspalum notatum var. saurae TaxID=547442 RepID=A0AAQ3SSB5_PASNO
MAFDSLCRFPPSSLVVVPIGRSAGGEEPQPASPVFWFTFFRKVLLNSHAKLNFQLAMAASGGSRKKKPCGSCKRYLDHLDDKNQTMSCFLRCMNANSKHSMVVPNKFLKRFSGKLSGTIKLESPNGSVYQIDVTECFNKVVFQHGWEEFVDAHHIEENDYLMFRHIEKSCFEVLIFDSDGCEKTFSCPGIRNTPSFQERIVDSADISSSSYRKTTESSASERFVKDSSCHRAKIAKVTVTSSSSEESGKGTPSENESFESDDLLTSTRVDYVLSHGSYLSEAQREKVIALIQEIQPESTVFVAVMKKSHVELPGPYLAIRKAYALEHIPYEGTHVTLQRPNKSKKWHPRIYKRKNTSVYMLRGQWLDFVRDNHVQVGDICLFFPTKGGKRFTFTVYLHRTRTITHSRGGVGFQTARSCHGKSSTKMSSVVRINEESTDGENVSSESGTHQSSHESLGSDSGGPSEPPYILSARNCLSQSQMKIVEERVQAIQSEVPIFVAVINKTNVGGAATRGRGQLIVLGTRFAAPHLPHRGQTMVLHCMKRTWKTTMSVSRYNGRTRWFLAGGWRAFVRDNGLRVRDICLFELKKNEAELTMKVHIISREQTGGSRMRKPCDFCKRYLEHLDEKNQNMSCFLRRMDASSKHTMVVPKGFVKNFAGKLLGWINLESPDGSLYDVEVTERYSKTVFRHGWEAFVDANHIEENDSMLFRHIEKSRFEVLILDSDGCEKAYSCAGIRNTPNVQGRSVQHADISISSRRDTTESSGSERLAMSERREDPPSGNGSFESDDLQAPPRADYVLSCKSYLSEAQRDRVNALIQEIKPETTVVVAIMRKSNIQRSGNYLVIPKEYASTHIPRGTQHVTLQRPGKNKKWRPILYIRKDRALYMLRGQWIDFVRENHVKEGDMCLLLPTKNGRKVTFMVYLLPATATRSRAGSGTDSQRVAGPIHEISDGSLNSNDSGGSSKPSYVLSRTSLLSLYQTKTVEAKVRATQSEFPVYVATMVKSNIAVPKPMLEYFVVPQVVILVITILCVGWTCFHLLSCFIYFRKLFADVFLTNDLVTYQEFGAKYADAHLPNREQTVVLQVKRETWKTKMVIVNGRRRFLRGGWSVFVHDNDLLIGDICLFELNKNEGRLTMKVKLYQNRPSCAAPGPAGAKQGSEPRLQPANRNGGPQLLSPCPSAAAPPALVTPLHRRGPPVGPPEPCVLGDSGVGLSMTFSALVPNHNQDGIHVTDGVIESFRNNTNARERSVDFIDISSSSLHDTTESSENEIFTEYQKGSICHRVKTKIMNAASSSSNSLEEKIISANDSLESDDLQPPPRADYVLSYRSYLSGAQKKRVVSFIQEIQPEITVFVAIMQKRNVQPPGPFLGISMEYAFAHFPHKSTNVTLQMSDKSKKWHPKFYKRNASRKNMLMGKWLDFVRDNHVQEGDICLLFPTEGGRRSTFTVYLLCATATHSIGGGAGFEGVCPCPGRSRAKMASGVDVMEEQTNDEHISLATGMHEISHEFLEPQDSGGVPQPPYIVPCRNPLSKSQKKIVEERVRAIQSEVPICVAVMKNNNVGDAQKWMLELGVRYAALHLPASGRTMVLQCMGKTWETQMVIHNGRRWFLNGGWDKFARDNGLRVGDICLFEQKKNERKLTMKNALCEVCGDIGYKQLLLRCRDCKSSSVHQYCLDKVIFDASLVEWFCYECVQRRGEVTCIRFLLQKASGEKPPSHAQFGSTVQLITKRVESERDGGPWRNVENKPAVPKYASINKFFPSHKKHTKKKSNTQPVGSCSDIKGRISKITAHANGKALHSCKTIETESATSSNGKNQQADHENQPAVNCLGASKDADQSLILEGTEGLACESKKAPFKGLVMERETVALESNKLGSSCSTAELRNSVLEKSGGKSNSMNDSCANLSSKYLDHDNHINQHTSVGCKYTKGKPVEYKKIVFDARQTKYWASDELRNSRDKSEAHCDNNSNIINGLILEREKEEARLQLDHGASNELHQRRTAADRPQLFTTQNDALDKVMPYSPHDGCEEVSVDTSVEEGSADSVDISSFSQHDTSEESESSGGFTKRQKGSSRLRRKTAKMAAVSSSSEQLAEDILCENVSLEYVLAYRSYLSGAQKKRVRELIQEIQPEFTVFISMMRRTNIQPPGPYLGITKEYAAAHFPDKTTTITLETPGKSKKWHPKFYKKDESRKNLIMGQWLDFVRDNHVQEGDICVFLPIKDEKRSTFMVYVFHETANHSRGGAGSPRPDPCRDTSGAKMASDVVYIEEEPTTGEHVSSESGAQEIPLESEDSNDQFNPPYFVPCKSPLSRSQKRIVEERVRAIRSEVPICVAVMKNNNVGVAQRWMLELGSRWASVYLRTRGQTVVLQCGGKTWEAKMMFHNGRRWFLNGGWPNFARGNGLRVGDICLFELKKKEEKLTMAVHISFSSGSVVFERSRDLHCNSATSPAVNMAGQGSQVKKSCAFCERYTDHLHGKMKCFLVHMSANYRHGMTIPQRFMNQFGGEISESIDIESPDGSIYSVKVMKHMNKRVPQCGWKAFVDDNNIKENDSLLFRRIQNSRFKVLVLDTDGCEKVFPCAGVKITSNNQERDTDCVDISDSSNDNTKKSRVRKRCSSYQRDSTSQRRKAARITRIASSSEESGYIVCRLYFKIISYIKYGWICFLTVEAKTLIHIGIKFVVSKHFINCVLAIYIHLFSQRDSEGTAEYESPFDLDESQTSLGPVYVLSRMSYLSEEQEEEVDELIKKIQPEVPVFVAVMKPSNVKSEYPNLVIRHDYADAHFPHKTQIVTLQRPGKNKKWHPKLYIRKDRAAHMLVESWSDFVQDNHVQEGDICIFEPVKSAGTKFTVRVHLIRQSKVHTLCESGNSPGGASCSRGRTRANVNDPKTVRSSEGRAKAKVTLTARVKEEPDHQGPLVSDDSGGPSKPFYILSSHVHLTGDQETKVEERVRSILSEVPIYVAVMTKSGVGPNGNCSLVSSEALFPVALSFFSKRYAAKYLPAGEQTLTLVRQGKRTAWKVKVRPRRGDAHAQTLSVGWRDFVHGNRLQLNDICLFQLMKGEKGLTMTVHIMRHGKFRDALRTPLPPCPTDHVTGPASMTSTSRHRSRPRNRLTGEEPPAKTPPPAPPSRCTRTKPNRRRPLPPNAVTPAHSLTRGPGRDAVTPRRASWAGPEAARARGPGRPSSLWAGMRRFRPEKLFPFSKSLFLPPTRKPTYLTPFRKNHRSRKRPSPTRNPTDLTVPNKFVRHFGDKIPGKIKLKVSNGRTCTVMVARYLNKLVLKAGWEAFVSTHGIKMGDFLVFSYNGNFLFEVLIFDPSCCVKAPSNVARNNCNHVKKKHIDPIEISSDSDDHQLSQSRRKKKVRTLCSDIPIYGALMTKSNITRDSCYLGFHKKYAVQYLPRETQILRLQRHGKVWPVKFLVSKSKPIRVNLDDTMSGSCERCREWNFWDMGDQRKYFFKIMLGDFRSRMTVPNKFVRHFRDKIPEKIKLKVSNGSTCTVVVARYLNKLVLKAGWEAFVSTHGIKMGDFLVFSYNGNSLFEVLIFDPSCCVKTPSNIAGNICHHVKHQHIDSIEISSDSDDYQTRQSRRCESSETVQSGGLSQNDMEMNLNSSTKKKVRTLCSDIPIYGALMTKSNITRDNCYLGFHKKYAVQYLPRDTQILRLKRHGKVWQVKFIVAKSMPMRFSQGWKEFARDNKLQIGDICLFEQLKNKTMLMMNVWKTGTNMRKPPKECRKSHTDYHDKHFFKVLIGDFHKRLVIPDRFAQHFRGKTARSIKLESYGGYTFDVRVAKNLGRVVLQFGWEPFVRAHDLKLFDFLVFKYDGISQMKVLIFDPSGCEKIPPYFVTKNATSGGQRREEPIDISDNSATLPMRTPDTEKKAWKQRDRSKINIRSSFSPSKSSGKVTMSKLVTAMYIC